MPIIHWLILSIDRLLHSQFQLGWIWLCLLLLGHSSADAKTSQRFTVTGHSMQPTLQPGDQVVINDSCVAQPNIALDDVVAIQFKHQHTPVIKRVVALPGSSFKLTATENNSVLLKQLKQYQHTIPKKHYIVRGDNQAVSQDSNDYGMIAEHQIIGCLTEVLKKS